MPTMIEGQNGMMVKQNTSIAVTGCEATTAAKPTLKVVRTIFEVKAEMLLVTVKTSATGTVKLSGPDLQATTKKRVKAGIHQIEIVLTKAAKIARKHRQKIKLRASLTDSTQTVAKTISIKL